MKLSLKLSVASELDKDDFVQQKPHEVEGLGNVAGVVTRVGHGSRSGRERVQIDLCSISGCSHAGSNDGAGEAGTCDTNTMHQMLKAYALSSAHSR